jgi:hypothetical protein
MKKREKVVRQIVRVNGRSLIRRIVTQVGRSQVERLLKDKKGEKKQKDIIPDPIHHDTFVYIEILNGELSKIVSPEEYSTLPELFEHYSQREEGEGILIFRNWNEKAYSEKIQKFIDYLLRFKEFCQEYSVDYCKGVILSGETQTIIGYQEFNVLQQLKRFDVLYIDKENCSFYLSNNIKDFGDFTRMISEHGNLFVVNNEQ